MLNQETTPFQALVLSQQEPAAEGGSSDADGADADLGEDSILDRVLQDTLHKVCGSVAMTAFVRLDLALLVSCFVVGVCCVCAWHCFCPMIVGPSAMLPPYSTSNLDCQSQDAGGSKLPPWDTAS